MTPKIPPEVREFVDVLPEPTLVLSEKGRVLFGNAASSRLLRTGRTGLEGRLLSDLTVDPPGKVETYLKLCSRTKHLLPGSLRLLDGDGKANDLRCDGAVLGAHERSAARMIFLRCRPKAEAMDHFALLNEKIAALSKEIMDRKKAEMQRDELLKGERAARVEAERVSRMKDEFLATLSHEIRTPLNAILGWTALLEAEDLPAAVTEGIDVIGRNARAQKQLIEDLLDMSRIISGKIRLDVQKVDLISVIESAVAAVRPAADAKGIRIQLTLDSIAGAVKGDPNRLLQVVWNLLNNAVKFTPKDGRVQVILERVNSHVEITIADNGSGISPEFLPHIFERFRQADASSTRRHGGLGIGLSIVKQLVELHGGSVWAKSPGEGKGATFIVMLPVLLVHEPAETGAMAERVHPTTTTTPDRLDSHCAVDLDGVDVLVVDDEPDGRELVKALLTRCKATVRMAGSAVEALALLDQAPPDVILSDVGMPGMDGYAFMRQVRSRPPSQGGLAPSIALTAFARAEDRMRALIAGYNLHMSKPVEPVELVVTVGTLVGRGVSEKSE